MAVTNPLIKELKGCTLKLYEEYQAFSTINDRSENLLNFYQTLEDIFYKGFINENRRMTIFNINFNRKITILDYYCTLCPNNFTYQNCIENAKSSKKTRNCMGKFRLLLKCCLVKKCLYLPVQSVISNTCDHGSGTRFYEKNSILGDEILATIFSSVLLQCSRIKFDLDLENSSFLDFSWEIPVQEKFEVLPCRRLGIGVSFNDDRAIIVRINPKSIIAESGKVNIGDMLESLNGIIINSSCEGKLRKVFGLNRGGPSSVTIVKAVIGPNAQIFPPIRHILLNLHIDLDEIKRRSQLIPSKVILDQPPGSSTTSSSDFDSLYLGCIQVGNRGDVKQLHKALKHFLTNEKENSFEIDVTCKLRVMIEIGETKVRVIDLETNETIFKHSFMRISSCGSLTNFTHHVAYMVEDDSFNISKFFCYIFYIENVDNARGILHSIGQGFQRTHYMV